MINKNFMPFPQLESQRLWLRQTETKDVDDLFEMISDPEVAEFEYFYPVTSKDQALKFIERYKEELNNKEEITWGLFLKETNQLIGTCCLGDFDEGARRAEIGYDISKKHWGKGYGSEGVKAVVDFGFTQMNLNRIEAFITPGNNASEKVLEKLKFTREGLVRQRDLMKGKLVDGVIMAMLKKEYVLEKNKEAMERVVDLRPITMDNFHDCINLKVGKGQEKFVASNMYSLAEAKADGVSIPLGIYHNNTLVGFTMYWFDEKNEMGWIDRLMVDEKYQKHGYGRMTMIQVIERLKAHEKCKIIRTSFEISNENAGKLYKSLGFQETGEICDGEVVCILKVK